MAVTLFGRFYIQYWDPREQMCR